METIKQPFRFASFKLRIIAFISLRDLIIALLGGALRGVVVPRVTLLEVLVLRVVDLVAVTTRSV